MLCHWDTARNGGHRPGRVGAVGYDCRHSRMAAVQHGSRHHPAQKLDLSLLQTTLMCKDCGLALRRSFEVICVRDVGGRVSPPPTLPIKGRICWISAGLVVVGLNSSCYQHL